MLRSANAKVGRGRSVTRMHQDKINLVSVPIEEIISKNSSWHYRSSTGSLYTILPEKFKQSEILAQWMPNMLCPTLLPMGILYEELSLFLGELFTGSEAQTS